MNIIGIALNPSKISLDCFKSGDLLDVRKVTNQKMVIKHLLKLCKLQKSNKIYIIGFLIMKLINLFLDLMLIIINLMLKVILKLC
jgi:hypothetical protein